MTKMERCGVKVHIQFYHTVVEDQLKTHYVQETGQWFPNEKLAIRAARKYLAIVTRLRNAENLHGNTVFS